MIDFLTSDASLLVLSVLGLVATGANIFRDARMQRARNPRSPIALVVHETVPVIEAHDLAA